jgi:hypothetical protein
MIVAPANPLLLLMPVTGPVPSATEPPAASFSSLLAVTAPMASIPATLALPSPSRDEMVAARPAASVSTSSEAQLPPTQAPLLAPVAIVSPRPAAAVSDSRNAPLQPAEAIVATDTLALPNGHQPPLPGAVSMPDPEPGRAPPRAATSPDHFVPKAVEPEAASQPVPASSPAAATATPRPARRNIAPENDVPDAGLLATASVMVIAPPSSMVPEPSPASDTPLSESAVAVQLPASPEPPVRQQPADDAPVHGVVPSRQPSGIAPLGAVNPPQLSNRVRSAAMLERSLPDADQVAALPPQIPTNLKIGVPPTLDPALPAVAPLLEPSTEIASTAIETPRVTVMPPGAAISAGPETTPTATTAPLPTVAADAVIGARRTRQLPRDSAEAPPPSVVIPGDSAPRLPMTRDIAPVFAAPREDAAPVKTVVDPIAETAVVTERFGDVRIAVEGTASDVKVSLALTPTAVLAPADAQRLASGLAADLAATGVRLQSLDISGGDTARGGASQGQRDPGPQRPPPSPLALPPSPALSRSDRYA